MSAAVTILATWGIYTLLGCGIVLVYRTSRVLNIAHGEIAILLGYLVVALLGTGLPVFASLGLGVISGAGMGLVLFWLFLRRVMSEPPYIGLMVTVGIAILLHGLITIIFGGAPVTIYMGAAGTTEIFGSAISLPDLLALAVAWISVGAIVLVYRLTKIGLHMRAVAERVTLSAQRGVNVDRIVAISWVIAVASASLAGAVHGERAVLSLPAAAIGISALIGCLIGGMDSLKGLFIGALMVSGSEYVVSRFIEPRYGLLAPIFLLLLILVIRPWGLFGTAEEIRRV